MGTGPPNAHYNIGKHLIFHSCCQYRSEIVRRILKDNDAAAARGRRIDICISGGAVKGVSVLI